MYGHATLLTVPTWSTTSIQTFIALAYRETGNIESILMELLHLLIKLPSRATWIAETLFTRLSQQEDFRTFHDPTTLSTSSFFQFSSLQIYKYKFTSFFKFSSLPIPVYGPHHLPLAYQISTWFFYWNCLTLQMSCTHGTPLLILTSLSALFSSTSKKLLTLSPTSLSFNLSLLSISPFPYLLCWLFNLPRLLSIPLSLPRLMLPWVSHKAFSLAPFSSSYTLTTWLNFLIPPPPHLPFTWISSLIHSLLPLVLITLSTILTLFPLGSPTNTWPSMPPKRNTWLSPANPNPSSPLFLPSY